MSNSSGRKKDQPWLVPLHDTVFIGYTDIAAAGSRSLLGVAGNKEIQVFEIPELPSAQPCTTLSRESITQKARPLAPLMVYHCTYMKNKIEGIPFSVLTCPAHKAEAGRASELDGSAEVIATMQEYLCDITHVGFSPDISCSLIYDGNPGENADMVAMIYV